MILLKNISILYGRELDYIDRAGILIKDGLFHRIVKDEDYTNIYTDKLRVIDCEGMLLMPSFINAHTHIADSIAKDITEGYSFNASIHPVFGIKRRVLENTPKEYIEHFIRASMLSMIRNGITTFIDFREQGVKGVHMLRSISTCMSIRCVILGGVEHYNSDLDEYAKREAEEVIDSADGFGLSGPNEYTDEALKYLAYIAKSRNKLFGIHAAEAVESCSYSLEMYRVSEVKRLLGLVRPDFVVHMTNATDEDILNVRDNGVGIVVCPRANASLSVGIPRVWDMLRSGCKLAIGTDNVMLNKPDIFREMEYIWNVSRALKHNLPTREILKMATVNAADIFGLKRLGYIDEGMYADAIVIDKYNVELAEMLNPYVSLVHRASESSIRCVMLNGNVVHGSIE